jgi:uncharacterized membrane protein HdeD (DUF308 family)
MIQNVGGIDRMLRIVAGLALIILAATGVLGPFAWLGIILMATGVFRLCMIYSLFGLSTCAIKPNPDTPAE